MSFIIAILVLQPFDAGEPDFIVDETNAGDVEAVLEELALLAADPVDFTDDGLAALGLIPDVPASTLESIQMYVRIFGAPKNELELLAIERVDGVFVDAIRPYVSYQETSGYQQNRRRNRSRRARPSVILTTSLRRPFELRAGNEPEAGRAGFLGGVSGYRTRVEFRVGRHIRARMIADHDPGEAFAWSPDSGSFGFDFISTGMEVLDVGPLKRLLIGDFTVRIGYGLAAWSGSRRSGSPGSRIPAPRATAITPKSGSNENDFLRGAAIELGFLESFVFAAFASKRRHDGSNGTGLHRSAKEQAERRDVTESTHGLLLRWTLGGLTSTASLIRINSTEIGDGLVSNGGLTLSFRSRWLSVSAEGGWHSNGRPSWMTALSLRPQHWFEVGSLVRWYPPATKASGPSPIGAGSLAAGTMPGWLTSFRFRYGATRLSFFRDQFVAASFTATRARPEVRTTLGAEIEIKPNNMEVVAGLLCDTREWRALVDAGRGQVRGLEAGTRFRIRLRLRLNLNKSIETRLTLVRQTARTEQGSTMTNEWRWQASSSISFFGGLTVFGGPSAVYSYEPSVRLQYSLLRLAGQGSRFYLMARFQTSSRIEIQIKYGQTVFAGERDIGSGLDYVRTDRLRQLTASAHFAI